MKDQPNKIYKTQEDLLVNVQQSTNALKMYNNDLEDKLKELENTKNESLSNTKKNELSESLQIAEDSKLIDSIEKDFDKSLIDIYVDLSDKTEEDF